MVQGVSAEVRSVVHLYREVVVLAIAVQIGRILEGGDAANTQPAIAALYNELVLKESRAIHAMVKQVPILINPYF